MKKIRGFLDKARSFAERHKKLTRFVALVFVVLLSSLVIYYRDSLKELEKFGYVGVFLLGVLGSASVIFPTPSFIGAFIGGGIFNPIIVGALSGIGAAIGELSGFVVGLSGQTMIEKHKTYEKVSGFIKKHSFIGIFFLALIPNPLFDIAGIAAGASGLSARQFLLPTMLGKTIRFIIISVLGAESFKILGL